MDTRHSSSVLPGAWSENWRDSQEFVKMHQEKPASRLERPESDVFPTNPSCIPSEQPLISEPNFPSAGIDNVVCLPFEDTTSLCSDSEDDSNLSDDFYSIVSEDDESSNGTLLPLRNEFNSTTDKGKGRAQHAQHPVALLEENFHPSVLSSRLHEGQDVTFPNVVLSKLHVPQAAQPPAGSEQPVLNTDGSPVSRTLDYAHEASASSRTSFIFKDDSSCSSGSVRFKKYESDDDSVCSNYSGVNYGRVYTMMNRLASGRSTMSTSLESTPRGPTQSSSRLINFRQINPRRINPDCASLNHSSTFSISHPDGNNPWTLSLDPALTSTESSPSQVSSRSFSQHSLNAEFPQRQPLYSTFFCPRSRASSIRQSISSPQNHTGIHDTCRPTRQGLNRLDHSIYALPATGSQSVYSDIRPATHVRVDSKPGNKNVLQKTKALCNKLKKLIVPKKPRQKIEEQCIPETSTLGYLDTSVELPPTLPYLNSPSTPTSATPSWSFDRVRPVKRLRKVSTPPENTRKTKSPSIENKNFYEYHARPKTVSEIKSSRRFSLPTFRASASQNHASK